MVRQMGMTKRDWENLGRVHQQKQESGTEVEPGLYGLNREPYWKNASKQEREWIIEGFRKSRGWPSDITGRKKPELTKITGRCQCVNETFKNSLIYCYQKI